MKQLVLLAFTLFIIHNVSAQDWTGKCPYKGSQIPANHPESIVGNFTITDTQGNEHTLYSTLDSGKTVFIDLFYSRCGWCQTYAPVIEQVYQDHGAGQGNIVFWGVSSDPYDTNPVIDSYKTAYNITNPCAGPAGGGMSAHNTIIAGQNFLGWPTYCVICPDRNMFFDPVYPPTVTGFDPFFEQCAAVTRIDENQSKDRQTRINAIYPNPVYSDAQLELVIDRSSRISLEVYNLLGQKVSEQTRNLDAGMQDVNLDMNRLLKGQYFVKILQDGQFRDIKKVVVAK
jgi:hypothetical protein